MFRPPSMALAVLFCTACASRDTSREQELKVLAAASLADVTTELARRFEGETGLTVSVSAGASGAMRKQIELGVPCDLFLSADAQHVDALITARLASRNSRRVLATNRLVVAVRETIKDETPMPRALTSPRYRRIAIANPEHAPAGRRCEEALRRAGLWFVLAPKIIWAGDVRSAARHVQLRTVDAAVIYETDALETKGVSIAYFFSPDAYDPIEYVGAVVYGDTPVDLRESSVAGSDAMRFLSFLASDRAAPVWRKHGFGIREGRGGTN